MKWNPFGKLRQEPGPDQANPQPIVEVGVAGARISSGFVHDEFLPQLVGQRGRRIYREMRDNDDTIGAIMFAIEMLLRAVEWEVRSDGTEGGGLDRTGGSELTTFDVTNPMQAVRFVEGVLFEDMNHTFEEFIEQALTMLTFGWQYTEIVFKRRDGIQSFSKSKPSSIYNDGRIGIHKLADRSQETLDRWDIDDKGDIYGLWQQPPNSGAGPNPYIPMSKSMLFRPRLYKGSPEGRSVLRNAYRSWYFKKHIQEIEAIGIERELNGLPVVYVPDTILQGATPEAAAAKSRYLKMVRDIKFNEQGGVILPSNPYFDADGDPSDIQQVKLELLSTNGSRAIDTDKVIKRYDAGIARTVLADFVMLGQAERGSFALSQNKTDLFLRATEGWLGSIESTINRQLLPKLWQVNGLDPQFMPYVKAGRVSPVDIEELGKYIKDLTGSGILLNDSTTEEYLRDAGGLPRSAGDGRPITNMTDINEFQGQGRRK